MSLMHHASKHCGSEICQPLSPQIVLVQWSNWILYLCDMIITIHWLDRDAAQWVAMKHPSDSLIASLEDSLGFFSWGQVCHLKPNTQAGQETPRHSEGGTCVHEFIFLLPTFASLMICTFLMSSFFIVGFTIPKPEMSSLGLLWPQAQRANQQCRADFAGSLVNSSSSVDCASPWAISRAVSHSVLLQSQCLFYWAVSKRTLKTVLFLYCMLASPRPERLW